ncbi:hypothetical protein GOP47_0025398 [Adiantum capillus-veneris]|uniref:Uncharacterized protein n=1 Tax=Adiantum capillus-veneris TaxID=13818 RepID=A0A9D4Z2Y9_ADICA|nr:hypothetical protein GOP47_0025398 [Adiantum capillus-veneris]
MDKNLQTTKHIVGAEIWFNLAHPWTQQRTQCTASRPWLLLLPRPVTEPQLTLALPMPSCLWRSWLHTLCILLMASPSIYFEHKHLQGSFSLYLCTNRCHPSFRSMKKLWR